MKIPILQIINETISDFYNDWNVDEPSVADKYYEKNLGIIPNIDKSEINGELIDYIDSQFGKTTKEPFPIYKNPKTINNFDSNCRGILMNTGDIYLSQSAQIAHETILSLLAEKGIVRSNSKDTYHNNYPSNFVAVIRVMNSNMFGQSSAYDYFPPQYQELFKIGSQKQPFNFKAYKMDTTNEN